MLQNQGRDEGCNALQCKRVKKVLRGRASCNTDPKSGKRCDTTFSKTQAALIHRKAEALIAGVRVAQTRLRDAGAEQVLFARH